MRPSQQATTGASGPAGSSAREPATSPWVGAAPDAAREGHDLGGADDEEARRRLTGPAALDDAERPAAHLSSARSAGRSRCSSRSSSACDGEKSRSLR